jgi:ParB/RepB/Spo0J family partition protein
MSNTEFEPATGPLVSLSINEIAVDETMNLRHKEDGIEELCADIMKRGQLQPVVVAPVTDLTVNGDPRYSLVAGFRRYKAIRTANEDHGADLPVLARVVAVAGKEALLDNLAENVQRVNLTPIGLARAVARFRAEGMTVKEIAKEFTKSEAWVRQTEALLTLSAEVQKAVDKGEIPFGVARKLVGLTEEEQATVIEAVKHAEELGDKGGQRAAEEARAKIKGKQKGGRKKKAEESAGRKGLSAKGAVLVFEEATEEIKGKSTRLTAADNKALDVYTLLKKLLTGGLGAQAFQKKMMEVLD